MKQEVKVAVVQTGSRLFDLDGTLDRFEQRVLDAARMRADRG